MLTVEQAANLKAKIGVRDTAVEGSQIYRIANKTLALYIEQLTVVDLEARLSPIVGIIRNMEMSHEEAVQRIIKALE